MIVELLQWIFAIFLIAVGGWVCLQSSITISERNRLRKETGRYYDFDIIEELARQEHEKQASDTKSEKVATTSKRRSKTTTTKTEL